jgi:hypothetical protein
MTDFHQILKRDLFKRIPFLREFLSAEDIRNAAVAGQYHWRERIWTPMQTLWTFLVQVLHPDCSCRAAVAQVLAEQAALGESLQISADPTAYCQARRRVPLGLFKTAFQTIGQSLRARVDTDYLWHERRVWVVDGSSCSMPDTAELQEAFGQPQNRGTSYLFFCCAYVGAKLGHLWLLRRPLRGAVLTFHQSSLQSQIHGYSAEPASMS